MRHTLLTLALAAWATAAWITAASAASPLTSVDLGQRPRLRSIYSGVHDLSQFIERDGREWRRP